MTYLLDANVFIEAKNLYYGFDFCPAFWDWLIMQNEAKKVYSIERVETELQGQDDELSEWAAARGPGFFLRPSSTMPSALSSVAEWANGQNYDQSAVSTFLQVADYYLIAQALADGHSVVTRETPAGGSRKRIKIPDVCIGLGVRCATPYEMLRAERARFIL